MPSADEYKSDKVNRSEGEKLIAEQARMNEINNVTVWQDANARQKVALDRMTDKFRAIYDIAYSVPLDVADLGIRAKAAIVSIREELAK